MTVAALFGSLLLLIAIGVPVGIAVGVATLFIMVLFSDIPLVLITQNCFTGIDSFTLLAVPFFILSGVLMGTGGIARRLLDAASAVVGFITGGLGIVSCISSMLFGAISGSSVATVSAIGTFMIPEMENKGYDKGFSTALMATAGTIGVIIPPSIPLVIYGVATNTSITDLFKAGIIPGVLMTLALSLVVIHIAKKKGYHGTGKFIGLKPTLRILWDAKLALLSPIVILGGIYAGIFTPTEAAVISVVYSIIVGKFVYKELDAKKIYRSIHEAAVISAITMFLIGFATTFATYISLEQIPQQIGNMLVTITDNKFLLLLIINIFLLFVGALIDNIPAVLILAPIFLPVVTQFGMSPVQFGVMMTLNLAIGFITPPYGVNLFAATAISGLSMDRVVKNIVPFFLAILVVLMILTYIPAASMLFVN